MSDHGHEPGGHEIDKMPNARLFNLLIGLSLLTLLSAIGVIQLFNQQMRVITEERDSKVSFRLQSYNDEMSKLATTWGRVHFTENEAGEDGKDKQIKTRVVRMPLADAKKQVLDDPKSMKAAPRYKGWKNPDPDVPEPAAGDKKKAPGAAPAAPSRPQPRVPARRPAPPRGRPAGGN